MDKKITCKDCGKDFIFTESEQKFLQKLVEEGKMTEYNEPKRCKNCRQAKKNQKRSY